MMKVPNFLKFLDYFIFQMQHTIIEKNRMTQGGGNNLAGGLTEFRIHTKQLKYKFLPLRALMFQLTNIINPLVLHRHSGKTMYS